MTAEFSSQDYVPSDIVAGNAHLLVSRSIILITPENLARGAVLGKITASGKYNLSLSGAADGSQTPDLILAEDTDASAADATTIAYERGDFLESQLTFGTAHTADSVREGLRDKGITLIKSEA